MEPADYWRLMGTWDGVDSVVKPSAGSRTVCLKTQDKERNGREELPESY